MELIELLVEQKANINAATRRGYTCLHFAYVRACGVVVAGPYLVNPTCVLAHSAQSCPFCSNCPTVTPCQTTATEPLNQPTTQPTTRNTHVDRLGYFSSYHCIHRYEHQHEDVIKFLIANGADEAALSMLGQTPKNMEVIFNAKNLRRRRRNLQAAMAAAMEEQAAPKPKPPSSPTKKDGKKGKKK